MSLPAPIINVNFISPQSQRTHVQTNFFLLAIRASQNSKPRRKGHPSRQNEKNCQREHRSMLDFTPKSTRDIKQPEEISGPIPTSSYSISHLLFSNEHILERQRHGRSRTAQIASAFDSLRSQDTGQTIQPHHHRAQW